MSLMRRIERGNSDPGDEDAQKKSQGEEKNSDDNGNRISGLRSRPISANSKRQKGSYLELKTRVQNRLLAELDPSIDVSDVSGVRGTIQELFESILAEENIVLTRPERQRLFSQIADEIVGYTELKNCSATLEGT